jgi:hypothetical protein
MPCNDCSRTEGCPPCVSEEPPMTPEEEEAAPPDVERPESPPQPQRRPPIAVAYSVNGHLFEVAVSGDAAVQAIDGALIIRHHLGPVAGIVQVVPVIDKEGADGAVNEEPDARPVRAE